MEDKKMKIITDDGKEIEYRILCAFYLSSTQKNYVVYTDDKEDKDGNIEVYASIYYPDDDTKLDEVKTKEEWDAIESILNDMQNGGEE